jgi:rhodanese-related sulfurtransferase
MNEALTQDEMNGKVSAGERCSVRRVSAQEAALMMGRPGVRVIDVRTPVEFEGARVAGAESFPLDRLDPGLLRGSGGGSVLVFCQSGGRAGRAAERLAGAGVDGCVVVDGGMDAWVAAGLPAVRGAGGGFPLMRQVQLVVGLLGATGAGLALWMDVRWAWLPLIIGAGLFVAGATGFCGLALVLARMPWNRRDRGTVSCSTGAKVSCCGGGEGGAA